MNIDILNAYCGSGSLPEPRLSEGRRTYSQRRPCSRPAVHVFAPWRSRSASHAAAASAVAENERLFARPRAPSPPYVWARVSLPPASTAWRRGSLHRETLRAPAVACPWASTRSCRRSVRQRKTCHDKREQWEKKRLGFTVSLTLRPQIRRDYPLNLSILISGGKETNKDSPSNGE